MILKSFSTALLLSAALASPALACGPECEPECPPDGPPPAQRQEAQTAEGRPVDLVICLDNSGSMDGLLDSARRKLWEVCTTIAQARPAPRLRVALISSGGPVVLQTTLTDELDLVYERLMALTLSGNGTELVGGALHEALAQLPWSDDPGALKVLFVAGNESADQDAEHPFRDQARAARERGIVVHAVYCGWSGQGAGDDGLWQELAQLGGGTFAAIDQSRVQVDVPTPFDEELSRLGVGINDTYLAFGARGAEGGENQRRQDENAAACDLSTLVARAECKGTAIYRNDAWDLVDARAREGFDWSQLAEEELPESLRGLTPEQRDAAIAALAARRAEIQARIQALTAARQQFLAEARAQQAPEGQGGLDQAMVQAVREQAEAAGFRFE